MRANSGQGKDKTDKAGRENRRISGDTEIAWGYEICRLRMNERENMLMRRDWIEENMKN